MSHVRETVQSSSGANEGLRKFLIQHFNRGVVVSPELFWLHLKDLRAQQCIHCCQSDLGENTVKAITQARNILGPEMVDAQGYLILQTEPTCPLEITKVLRSCRLPGKGTEEYEALIRGFEFTSVSKDFMHATVKTRCTTLPAMVALTSGTSAIYSYLIGNEIKESSALPERNLPPIKRRIAMGSEVADESKLVDLLDGTQPRAPGAARSVGGMSSISATGGSTRRYRSRSIVLKDSLTILSSLRGRFRMVFVRRIMTHESSLLNVSIASSTGPLRHKLDMSASKTADSS
ncbi:hypothetical protein GQ44DRAFT_733429 [Phaeosphaeriaceae sp. PMI808]|nr:hypothetical protein GQ44DRAFT_733429 [Phaeosphaeriaceae sp. PMI808]